LAGLNEQQRAVVESVTRGMLAKLLHEPTVQLKAASGSARGDQLADALRTLFDLSPSASVESPSQVGPRADAEGVEDVA
jgi:glutamyl-tRNA reductase